MPVAQLAPLLVAAAVCGTLLGRGADAGCSDTAIDNVWPDAVTIANQTLWGASNEVQLNVPPRYMWGWGPGVDGYCGSCSTQSAALYFGMWISQEFVRYAAGTANVSQVLLGTSHVPKVAETFGLNIEYFDNDPSRTPVPQVAAYLEWVVGQLRKGRPVIAGVFERKPNGDGDYDHIVPLTGVTIGTTRNTNLPASSANVRTNVSSVTYNDLYLNRPRTMSGANLAVTRSAWTTTFSPSQPYSYALPQEQNYGVAIFGLKDPGHETYRLKLTAWSWTEPDWGREDDCRDNPAPAPIDFSAAIYGLTRGNKYAVLRFDGNTSAGDVTSGFLASGRWVKRWDFTAMGSEHTLQLFDRTMSNAVVTYRAVLVSGRARSAKGAGSNTSGGLVGSRVPLALLIFAALGASCAVVWYLTKRYWERKNPLYDPTSTAAPRRARAASHTEQAAAEEGATLSSLAVNESEVEKLEAPLTGDRDAATVA